MHSVCFWFCAMLALCGTCVAADDAVAGLLEVARTHVEISERTQGDTQLWGRVGGSGAERASARLLRDQLRPYLEDVKLETVEKSEILAARWIGNC